MTTRGIDIRQTASRIVFRASLKDSDGAKVTTGTTELRFLRVNDDGTLDVLDWTTFAFVAPGAGTPDDETEMTHRVRRDSSGADVATGIWTAVLTTLTNFTEGQIYITQITNPAASPESQEREFQFGGVEGKQLGVATEGREFVVESDGVGHSDVKEWLGVAPLALVTQRVQTTANETVPDNAGIAAAEAAAIAAQAAAEANTGGIALVLADTNEIQTDLADGGRLDLLVDAIKAKTDTYVVAPTANQNADALLDRAAAIDGKTPREAIRIIAATTAGELSGVGTLEETFVGLDGVTVRVTTTLDSANNRTGIVYG